MGYFNRRETFTDSAVRKKQRKELPASERESFFCGEEIEKEIEKKIEKKIEKEIGKENQPSILPVDFSDPTDEMETERDFRMLQSMYPNTAKELLPLIEEECDRMEYGGSAMFDEYPDDTTVYNLQKRIADAHRQTASENSLPFSDLIRVMLLQEMHRRRTRYRSFQGK